MMVTKLTPVLVHYSVRHSDVEDLTAIVMKIITAAATPIA
jgi:hypothetical protein